MLLQSASANFSGTEKRLTIHAEWHFSICAVNANDWRQLCCFCRVCTCVAIQHPPWYSFLPNITTFNSSGLRKVLSVRFCQSSARRKVALQQLQKPLLLMQPLISLAQATLRILTDRPWFLLGHSASQSIDQGLKLRTSHHSYISSSFHFLSLRGLQCCRHHHCCCSHHHALEEVLESAMLHHRLGGGHMLPPICHTPAAPWACCEFFQKPSKALPWFQLETCAKEIRPLRTIHSPQSNFPSSSFSQTLSQEDLDLPSWPPILAEGMKPGPCTCLDTSAPIPSTPPGTRSVREPNPANCCFPTDGCTEVPEVARVLLTQCWKQYKIQMDVMSSSTVQNFYVADENLWCFIPVNCICIWGIVHCGLVRLVSLLIRLTVGSVTQLTQADWPWTLVELCGNQLSQLMHAPIYTPLYVWHLQKNGIIESSFVTFQSCEYWIFDMILSSHEYHLNMNKHNKQRKLLYFELSPPWHL